MSDKTKSIWRKSFKGPRGLVLVFTVLAFAVFVVLFALGLMSAKNNSNKDLLIFSLLGSLGTSAIVVFGFAFLRWAFCRQNLRRTFFALACLATLIALFYAEENWRGKHAWEKYKREQEAKGEKFDLKDMAPPSVPDDRNFSMAPIFIESFSARFTNGSVKLKSWYGNKRAALDRTNLTDRLEMLVELSGRGLSFTNDSGDWRKAEQINLKAWQEYYRDLAAVTNFFPVSVQPQASAKDVLFALSKYDSSIEELRAAGQRSYSRFPVSYGDENPAMILLPHLAAVKSCLYPLRLRAIAELKSSQSSNALEDVKLMFRLMDSIRNEPILVSQLVRIAELQITLQPVWEGLAERQWTDAQLVEIDSKLSKLDFLADFQFSMRGERGLGVGVIDYLQHHRKWLEYIGDLENSSEKHTDTLEKIAIAASRAIPSGWFEQNKLSICKMYSDHLFPIVNQKTHVVLLTAQRRASIVYNRFAAKRTPYNWFARLLLPAFGNIAQKSAYSHQSTDLARVAIALERYRLTHGSFPETLDSLAPQFLPQIPHDIIDGRPLNYRRTNDGKFILYSVGWNGTDEGGSVVLEPGKKTENVDIKRGDWVWKYPAK